MDVINNVKQGSGRKSKPYPIVAIGASAGGLEAMTELLKHLPAQTGMAYVYIQHLDRYYESNLTAILTRATSMKVQLGENRMKIEPDCLFVIPPNKEMAIVDGVIAVTPRPEHKATHMPIDRFFLSMAEKQKEGSIGIVLSGAASDGTIGLKAIKMAGGLTFAQNDTALFKSMPKSAAAEGAVDMVLSPKEMAEELERLSKQVNTFSYFTGEDDAIENEEELKNILQIIRKSSGVDFSHYKINTIRRRIVRRMLLYKLPTLADYENYLKQHANEASILYSDLLINVTTFFRDEEGMAFLQREILPRLIQQKTANDPLRIWVPACSTGEEPYTLAMVVLETLGEKAANTAIQIFATDLSELAINKARLGIYSASDLANISPERLQRFFTKVDGSYRIIKSIRDLCVFAPHNIFKDPPFSRLDLISCCNLLIYLDSVLQKKIMATFHYALNNNNGYLLLGKSETVATATHLFSSLDKKVKVYKKKSDTASRPLMDMNFLLPEREQQIKYTPHPSKAKEISPSPNLDRIIDNIFLTRFMPPSVVITPDLEIIQFRGATHAFLEPAPGRASFNILKMVHAGLAVELRSAIHKCLKTGEIVKLHGLQVQRKDDVQQVDIEVQPLELPSHGHLMLVIFNEVTVKQVLETNAQPQDFRIKQLENELTALREDMRIVLEEQEAINEEMQSANEEVVSSNEELQSINEELETSKEEIESTNEELITINQELMIRNNQLAEAQEYGEAIIATIREAVVLLDKDLRIRSANKAFYRIFHLKKEETEGMLIYELDNKQWDIPRLRSLLEELIPHNSKFNSVEITHTFSQLGEKVLVFDGRKIIQESNKKQIILLSIEDITDHRKNQRLVAEREAWLRHMTDTVPVLIWMAGPDRKYSYLNKTWQEYTGHTLEQELDNGWLESIHRDDIGHYLNVYKHSFENEKPLRTEYRMRRHDGDYRWMLCTAVPTYTAEGAFTGFIGSCIDIHTEKLMNEELEKRVQERTQELQQLNHNLEHSNKELEQFAYVASHDMQEPLRKIIIFSDRLDKHCHEILPELGKEYIKKITSSSRRMSQLIDDLLNFSKISHSKTVFTKVDLNKIIQSLLVDFELQIKEKAAQIIMDNSLPELWANWLQITQLFHNLLSNALKFAKEDQPLIVHLHSRQLPSNEADEHTGLPDKGKVYYEITVQDNGIGFEQEYAEKAFTIFQRLHERSKYPGTGIGLSLCRKIVENHNGAITAQSAENVGTTFTIILPETQA